MIHSSHCEKTTVFGVEQRLIILVLVAIATKFENKQTSLLASNSLKNFKQIGQDS